MPQLLVSIRNLEEAQIARDSEIDWIDAKEPSNGPLGKPENRILNQIAIEINGKSPLSAAMGEISDYKYCILEGSTIDSYSIIKFGTARTDFPRISSLLAEIIQDSKRSTQSLVLAAYADSQRANSPSPGFFPEFCANEGMEYLLIDTFVKDSSDLFSWLSIQELEKIRDRCEKLGIKLALAGRLTIDKFPIIQLLDPHVVGLRGAVCEEGIRDNRISPERISLWKSSLKSVNGGSN